MFLHFKCLQPGNEFCTGLTIWICQFPDKQLSLTPVSFLCQTDDYLMQCSNSWLSLLDTDRYDLIWTEVNTSSDNENSSSCWMHFSLKSRGTKDCIFFLKSVSPLPHYFHSISQQSDNIKKSVNSRGRFYNQQPLCWFGFSPLTV